MKYKFRFRGKVAPNGSVDPYVATVAKMILEGDMNVTQLAKRAGVSTTTIYSWLNGKTRRPCRLTLEQAMRQCGNRMAIVPLGINSLVHEVETVKSYKYTWSPSDIVRRKK